MYKIIHKAAHVLSFIFSFPSSSFLTCNEITSVFHNKVTFLEFLISNDTISCMINDDRSCMNKFISTQQSEMIYNLMYGYGFG